MVRFWVSNYSLSGTRIDPSRVQSFGTYFSDGPPKFIGSPSRITYGISSSSTSIFSLLLSPLSSERNPKHPHRSSNPKWVSLDPWVFSKTHLLNIIRDRVHSYPRKTNNTILFWCHPRLSLRNSCPSRYRH